VRKEERKSGESGKEREERVGKREERVRKERINFIVGMEISINLCLSSNSP
jgi:hypothetical protein